MQLSCAGVVDAARYSAHRVLQSGKSLALVPGGGETCALAHLWLSDVFAATEALYCDSAKDVVYLKKRTGFVRLALETGASLVPVFSFVC